VPLTEGAVEQPRLMRSTWQLSAKPAQMAATAIVTILAECCGQGGPTGHDHDPGGPLTSAVPDVARRLLGVLHIRTNLPQN
jgi:hypothetical protein